MASKPCITELLDDYTKASFPYEVNWSGHGKVRLLAAFDNKVVGASYGSFERDGETIEFLSQSLHWDGQGVFANGEYPEMNLPPPPAKTAEQIARLREEVEAIEQRLEANPDAPEAWTKPDQNKLSALAKKIAELTGEAV